MIAAALAQPTARRGRVDAGASLLSTLVVQASGFAAGLLVARALGAEARGVVALVALTYGQAASIASLGFDSALLHFGARAQDDLKALARRGLLTAVGQGLVAAVVGWVLLRTLLSSQVSPARGAITIAALAAPAVLVVAHGHAVLRAAGRLVEASVLEVVAAVTTLTVVVGGVVTDRLGMAAAGAAAGSGLCGILTAVLLQRLPGAGGAGRAPASFGTILRYGLAGHVGTVFQSLNYRVDVFLVALLLSATDVGIYAVAVSLAEALLLLPNALGALVMQRAALDPSSVRATQLTLRLGLAVATVGGVVVAVVSVRLVPLVFGREFAGATAAILALLPGILALVVWKTLVNDLAGRGFPTVKSVSAGLALVVTLAADLVLIPSFGIAGAAAASSAAYAAAAAVAAQHYRSATGRSLCGVVRGR